MILTPTALLFGDDDFHASFRSSLLLHRLFHSFHHRSTTVVQHVVEEDVAAPPLSITNGGVAHDDSNATHSRHTHSQGHHHRRRRRVNKQLFSKMFIEAGEHPFFKRVWLARHVLDGSSPLLKPAVRHHIRRGGGAWPSRLNSYAAIRSSLQFNQILVSLNGVSNISASEVYAQKIYDFCDVNIGYEFVNILCKDGEGRLMVDTDLINDVRQQHGGGGEPLIDLDDD